MGGHDLGVHLAGRHASMPFQRAIFPAAQISSLPGTSDGDGRFSVGGSARRLLILPRLLLR